MTEQARKGTAAVGSSKQILSLIRSYANRDERRFISVALELAEDAARKGHVRLAEEMQAVINEAKAAASAIETTRTPIPLAKPRGELAAILSASFPRVKLSDLVRTRDLEVKLGKIVTEQRQRDRLGDFGLSPRRKFLLSGPPGTGKTLTAEAVAGELNYPLFTILLDGLITKFMGETAAKLRLVFDAMATTRGVYFFDEVDALATSRAISNDVGEARRILNSLLMFLDEDKSSSLVFAATNHPELLDRAVYRRFNSRIRYSMPDETLIRPLLESNLLAFDLSRIDWETVVKKGLGLSQTDLARSAEDAAREAVLEHGGLISTTLLISAIEERRQEHG
jgi:SpoVK/Ycf46/Vps4 family AAA+-type ATPase